MNGYIMTAEESESFRDQLEKENDTTSDMGRFFTLLRALT